MARKSDVRKLEYDEKAMKLGIEFYRQSEIPLDLLYHLMKAKRLRGFSAIMIRSSMAEFGDFLQRQKRKTDLLHPISPEEGIYALLCQETQVDGGYYFIRRLLGEMGEEADGVCAAIVGVESTRYPIRDLMFIVLDSFIRAMDPENGEKIVHRTVK